MANAPYGRYLQAIASFSAAGLAAPIDVMTDTIRFMLVDAALYTPNLATHQFFSDVPAGARKGNNGNSGRADMPALANKSVSTAGLVSADPVTILTLPAGDFLEYGVIFKDSGADGTSPLIQLIDTGTGLPVRPNGGSPVIRWPSGIYIP